MKILYVAGMYPTQAFPQNGIFCHEQVKALQKMGIVVDVAVPYQFYHRSIKKRQWKYEGVAINYVSYLKIPGAADFHRAGIALYHALNKRFDLTLYDLYHADAALPTGHAVMLASKKYCVPYIVHGHGLDVFLDVSYQNKPNCQKIVQAGIEVYRSANAITGVSNKVNNNIEERLPETAERLYTIYNGVNPELFYPESKNNEKITVAAIGNLIPLKGHDYVLRAMKEIEKKYPGEFCLRIYGRGPLESELKKQALDLSIQDIVSFEGYIPYEEIASEMRKIDIFVLPSWYEALGCVYLEAMSCGVPAVGCYNNGIAEIIHHGVNGYLVREKNVEDIVDVLEKLRDKDKRNQIGIEAKKSIENSYTWEHSARSLIKVYKKVVNEEY